SDDRGANREPELQVAPGMEDAEGAGVRAARPELELADDLHGAALRGAGDRAAWERRPQELCDPDLRPQLPRHRRHEMVDGGVALDVRERIHPDGAGDADAAEVVALEVDDHHMLRPLLRVGEQLGGERGITEPPAAARARSLDRARLDPGAPPAEKQL